MAEIKMTAFVNGVKETRYGTVLEVAETFRKQDESGEWVRNGENTYYDVWVDRADVEPGCIREGALLAFTGRFRTRKTEKDGKTYYQNTVNALTVTSIGRRDEAPRDYSDETPF